MQIESNQGFEYYRNLKLKRDQLFENVKKFYNEKNKKNSSIQFKEWWTVFSVCRDAVVHSSNFIKSKEVSNWKKVHLNIFDYLFHKSLKPKNDLVLTMGRREFSKSINAIAEFGFQIFKQISIKQNLEWKILYNYGIIPSKERQKRRESQSLKENDN